jgi:LCP family protein required for cell wall assembly
VDSTIYRRSQSGAISGTPELNPPPTEINAESVYSVSTFQSGEITDTQSQPIYVESSELDQPANSKSGNWFTNLKSPFSAIKMPWRKSPKVKSAKRFPRPVRYIRNIVLAYLAFYVVLGFHAATSLNKIPATASGAIADTAGTNWILVGSDSREGLTKAERKELRTGADEGSQRTDTLMVIHITDEGTPTLVSLPRDSYVIIPAHTALDGMEVTDRRNKINTAYSKGGAPLLVETVERNTGLRIDNYMEIGFKGIRDITNAVGGVNMCVPADVTDENSGLNLLAGCQELDGRNALAYVRMRYADPRGDLGRVERQQQFLSSVMKKAATPAVLLNPVSMWKLVDASTGSVNVGTGDSVQDLANLAIAMRSLSNGQGALLTVPVTTANATTAAGSSVLWDEVAARELFVSLGAN